MTIAALHENQDSSSSGELPATNALEKLSSFESNSSPFKSTLTSPPETFSLALAWPKLLTKNDLTSSDEDAIDFPLIEWNTMCDQSSYSDGRPTGPTRASIQECLKTALSVVDDFKGDFFSDDFARSQKRRCGEYLGGMRRSIAVPSSLQHLNQLNTLPHKQSSKSNLVGVHQHKKINECLVSSRISYPMALPKLGTLQSKLLHSSSFDSKFSSNFSHHSRTSKPNCAVSPLA